MMSKKNMNYGSVSVVCLYYFVEVGNFAAFQISGAALALACSFPMGSPVDLSYQHQGGAFLSLEYKEVKHLL